jgi:general stress protein 26
MGITIVATPDESEQRANVNRSLDDLVNSASIALITTVDSTGIMHTRQLPNTNSECNEELWFLSSMDTPLVHELRANPEVLITYASRGTSHFVVVNGEAEVRVDPVQVHRFWHPVLASWLPGGPHDPALVLLRVRVKGVELWE